MRTSTLLLCSFVLLLASCATAPKKATVPAAAEMTTAEPKAEMMAPSYAGTWAVVVNDTPMGTVKGDLMLEKSETGLTGKYVSGGQEFPLKKVEATETGLMFVFFYSEQGVDVDVTLKGAASANALAGQTMGQFMTTATRKE